MRGSRGVSNDTTRRMDKEHGSRNENGRRGNHPTNPKADKERKEDRLSEQWKKC